MRTQKVYPQESGTSTWDPIQPAFRNEVPGAYNAPTTNHVMDRSSRSYNRQLAKFDGEVQDHVQAPNIEC